MQRLEFEPPLSTAPAKAAGKTKDRYYIYSHTKNAPDSGAEETKQQQDKSRPPRSAPSLSADRKQVSRNISLVLENLLMSYDNSQLPTHGQGLRTFIHSLNPFIDYVN